MDKIVEDKKKVKKNFFLQFYNFRKNLSNNFLFIVNNRMKSLGLEIFNDILI